MFDRSTPKLLNRAFTPENAGEATARWGKPEGFRFAVGHALVAYRTGAIYSYIPKNGCTTLKFSLGLANGFIDGSQPFAGFAHPLANQFVARTNDIALCNYAFIVVREPGDRLVSCFLDKMLQDGKERADWISATGFAGEDITFRDFVEGLRIGGALRANHHWRPQQDFFLFDTYDDVIPLPQLNAKAEVIRKKAGISLVDTRDISKHNMSRLNRVSMDDASTMTTAALREMKGRGELPETASFLTDGLRDAVADIYAADADIYERSLAR